MGGDGGGANVLPANRNDVLELRRNTVNVIGCFRGKIIKEMILIFSGKFDKLITNIRRALNVLLGGIVVVPRTKSLFCCGGCSPDYV